MWLTELRKAAGLTQKDVANKAGVSRAAYSNIEIGARRPSVENAKKIAAVLGFPWTRFYENTGEETA